MPDDAEGRAAVDAYIAEFPPAVRALLGQMRDTIRAAAPQAAEKIGYGVPTFTLGGNLVHFAGYAGHIGFYPGSSAIAAFADELSGYKRAKGSVQFPLNAPLPIDLVARMVAMCVEEQLRKAAEKRRPKPR